MKKEFSSSPKWLDLSKAADYLGVHFSTLRRWADQGKIAHMRTPGGRRRFALSDLQNFVQQGQQKPDNGEQQDAPVKLGQVNVQVPLQKEGWMQKVSDLDRIKLKGTGQMMLGLLMQYISRSENSYLFLDEARNIARDMGAICARAGMNAREVVTAFLLFRSTILEMVLNTSAVDQSLDEEGRQLNKRTNEYMDAVLIAIIAGYSEA